MFFIIKFTCYSFKKPLLIINSFPCNDGDSNINEKWILFFFINFKLFSHWIYLIGQDKVSINQNKKSKSLRRCGGPVEGKEVNDISFQTTEIEVLRWIFPAAIGYEEFEIRK